MFDTDLKKKELAKKREQALARVKLPPLGGKNSEPSAIVLPSNILHPDDVVAHYLANSGMVKRAYEKKAERRDNEPIKELAQREPGEEG